MRHVLTCIALAAAGCGDEASDASEGLSGSVGPEGGALTAASSDVLAGFSLEIPEGALPDTTEIAVGEATGLNPLPEGGVAVGPTVFIDAGGVELARPVRVTLPFDPDDVTSRGEDLVGVKVWFVGPDGRWALLDAVEVGADTVTVELAAFTALGAGLDLR